MQWKFTLFAGYLLKSHFREKSGSWDRGQNALSQSDCWVFKSNYIFRENDEIAFFSHVDFKSYKFKSWLKTFRVDMIKNGCDQSNHTTQKLTVSQEWIAGISWFFCLLIQVKRAASCFNDFWVDMVKNVRGLLVHGTLKSAVS